MFPTSFLRLHPYFIHLGLRVFKTNWHSIVCQCKVFPSIQKLGKYYLPNILCLPLGICPQNYFDKSVLVQQVGEGASILLVKPSVFLGVSPVDKRLITRGPSFQF